MGKKYYEKYNERVSWNKIEPEDVVFDNGRICVYYEKMYGETCLCVGFNRFVLEVCRATDKKGLYVKKSFYIDHLDRISKTILKTICNELLKLKVITLDTRFIENRLNKKVKLDFTVREVLEG